MLIDINSITVSGRIRSDVGDIESLARSMKKLGQLQPIGIDSDSRLVFGERRVRAAKSIGWTHIDAVSIDCDCLSAEHDENEMRKQFTVTERLEIAQRIAERMGARQGQRNDIGTSGNISRSKGYTRDIAAKQSGLGSGKTLEAAKKVVEKGTPELVKAMDEGKVSIHAAAAIATLPEATQRHVDYTNKAQIRQAKEKAEQKNRISFVIEYSDIVSGANEMAKSIIARDSRFAAALFSALGVAIAEAA